MPETPPPFITHLPAGMPSPIVFDSPHSGSFKPDHVYTAATDWERAYLRDSHVEKLLKHAPAQGVPVLECLLDRIVIDMNSEEYEIDPKSLSGLWLIKTQLTKNVTQRGLGLIATTMKQRDGSLRPIFTEATKPHTTEIMERLRQYYWPYHQTLKNLIEDARTHHGFGVHVNFHSSPRQAMKDHDIVLGNLHGSSANPALTHFISSFFSKRGHTVRMNTPYAGGALIRKHSQPRQGIHGVQIELARELFTTENFDFDAGKAAHLQKTLEEFTLELQDFVKAQAPALRASKPPASPAAA